MRSPERERESESISYSCKVVAVGQSRFVACSYNCTLRKGLWLSVKQIGLLLHLALWWCQSSVLVCIWTSGLRSGEECSRHRTVVVNTGTRQRQESQQPHIQVVNLHVGHRVAQLGLNYCSLVWAQLNWIYWNALMRHSNDLKKEEKVSKTEYLLMKINILDQESPWVCSHIYKYRQMFSDFHTVSWHINCVHTI